MDTIGGLLQLVKGYLLKDLQGIFFISKLLKGSHLAILKELFKDPNSFAKRLAKLTPAGRLIFSKELDNAIKSRYAPFQGKTIKDTNFFTPEAKQPEKGTKTSNKNLDYATFTRKQDGTTQYASVKQVNQRVYDLMKKLGLTEEQAMAILQHQVSEGTEFALLSSSWIQSGEYKLTSLGVGELTISVIATGKAYTYPGVVPQVWEAMKGAKGKNGSGAGSVFWALYLRGYRTSYYGRQIATMRELLGSKLNDVLSSKAKKVVNLLPGKDKFNTIKKKAKKVEKAFTPKKGKK